MSYNPPYRKPQDDFGTNHDMYADSQRMYHRESGAYRSRTSASSQEHMVSPTTSKPSVLPPGKALSFLHSCGLDTEDLQTLAELPEHLISAEKLPDLLAEIKKKKAANASSSRSSTLQHGSSGRSWEDRSYTQPVEYSSDLPVRESYSHQREQDQTWEDRWGNVKTTSSLKPAYTSSKLNYVVEYNHLKDKDTYFDKPSYAAETSKQKTTAVSQQSYSNYNRDISQPSYLTSRDAVQPSHLSSRDAGQSSFLSSKDIGQLSNLSTKSAGLPSLLSSINIAQPSLLSNRNIVQPSLLSNRNIVQPSLLSSRNIGQLSQLSSKNVGQSSHLSNRVIGQPSQLSGRNVGQPARLSSRDISQPSYLSSLSSSATSYSSIQSGRNISQPSHLSSRDVGRFSDQRRAETIHTVPTRKEASDFHGKTPPVFPYACVLCEITVLSNKDWSLHIKGAQHANSQLSLVERYPQWDQRIQSARRNDVPSEKAQLKTKNGSSSTRSGLSSTKSETLSSKKKAEKAQCTTVCVKFEEEEVDEAYLRKLLGQFGAIVKLVMFPRMAFADMGSELQATDIVKYFIDNPLRIKSKLIEFSLSAPCNFLQTSRVVSFSPLPTGEGVQPELMAIAKRFGSLKNTLFVPNRAFMEMGTAEEASNLVEHYSTHSLKIKGKTIHVSFSTEYHTLRDKCSEKEESSRRRRRRRRSLSPRRRSHSSRKDSPSPKRRERSRSQKSTDSRKQDESRGSKERTRESSRRDRSSRSHSKKSPSKDKQTKEAVEQKTEDSKNQSDIVCDDSDLEGVAVIADDCEELNSDEEFIEVDQDIECSDEEDLDSSMALTEQEVSEDIQEVKESDDNTIPSESVSNATVLDESSDCKEVLQNDQELQHNQDQPEDKVEETSEETSQCKESQELQDNQEAPKDETVGISKELSDKDAEELHQTQGEPKEETGEISDASNECKKAEVLQQNQDAQKDEHEAMEQDASDVPVNLESSITTDEFREEMTAQGDIQEVLTPSAEETFGRVLEVKGFPQAKKYSEDDLLNIGKKYGEVADCCLVRSNRKVEKALIEMVNAADASKLEAASKRQNLKLGGKVLRITVSDKYSQVKERVIPESDSGKAEDENLDSIMQTSSGKADGDMQTSSEKAEDDIQTFSEKAKDDIQMSSEKAEDDMQPSSRKTDNDMQASSGKADDDVQTSIEKTEDDMQTSSGKPDNDMQTSSVKADDENLDSIMETSSDEEEPYGKVLRIRNLPPTDKYTNADFLSIAEPYGKVKRHWLLSPHHMGLIEMENASDAEKVVAAANKNKITIAGKHPKITVSTKHSSLNKRYFLYTPTIDSQPTSAELGNDKDESKTQHLSDQESSKQVSASDEGPEAKTKDTNGVSELDTKLSDAVGTEFIRPVVGYFCNLCNVIYANEEEAKSEHCRTVLHHQKLKEHMDQKGSA
ncbi:matrin 3-like 1.1 [Paramisgurnus dabryanus]|uniref:matrin 3-like 1.1 n=1 Tax=Paramisgurnus dabryanus TaxID=90735 RepID=UPI0031F409AA